jgi:hypothetical protein
LPIASTATKMGINARMKGSSILSMCVLYQVTEGRQ